MENSEILSNLSFYEGELRTFYPYLSAKRVDTSSFMTFRLDAEKINHDEMAKHSKYLIKSLREMILKNEKEQKIHRHYGFLQCLLIFLLEYSLEDVMRHNKNGTLEG
jgi:Zn/Cd-binding protein ZinT